MPTIKRTVTKSGVGSGTGGGGGGGAAGLFGMFTIIPASGHALIDIAALGVGTTCFNFKLTLTSTVVQFVDPVWTGGTLVAGIKIWIYVGQDGTGGRAKPSFIAHGLGINGFTSEFGDWEIDGGANLWNCYQATFQGTIWTLDFVRRGMTMA